MDEDLIREATGISERCVDYADRATFCLECVGEIERLNLPDDSLKYVFAKRFDYYISQIKIFYDGNMIR